MGRHGEDPGQSQPAKPCRAAKEQPGCLAAKPFIDRRSIIMTSISRLAFAAALGLCAVAYPDKESTAASETRRLCDRKVTYDVVPPVDVPANLANLSGVWRGTI